MALPKILSELQRWTPIEEVSMSKDIACFQTPEKEEQAFEIVTGRGQKPPEETISIRGQKFKIYTSSFGEEIDYYFVGEKRIEGGYDLLVTIQEGEGGEDNVQMVCKNPNSSVRGLAKKIYLDYFVEKFGSLYSDETQSPQGFALWQSIFKEVQNKPNMIMFAVDSRGPKKIPITKMEELGSYYGESPEMYYFRFMVEKL